MTDVRVRPDRSKPPTRARRSGLARQCQHYLSAFVILASVSLLSIDSAYAQPSDAELEDRLYEALLDTLPWPEATIQIANVRLSGDAPEGDYVLEIANSEHFRGRVRARVMDLDGGRGSAWLSADLMVELPVLVASRAIPRGARLDDFVHSEMRDLNSLPSGFVCDMSAVRGMTTRRALREGQAIRSSQLEAPLMMERNQIVTIAVQRGQVTITDRGIALENGREGEVIQVRSLSSDSVLTAVVRSQGLVEIP